MQSTGPMTTRQKFEALLNGGSPVPAELGHALRRRRQTSEGQGGPWREVPAEQQGVYIISVAARILSMHPQTLRKYERVGLVRPSRTIGMLRLYSEEDVAKLRMIKYLVDELRLNLAGVEMALAVFERLLSAKDQMQTSSVPSSSVEVFEQAMQDILALLQGRQVNSKREQE